ncbi:hypothetical protein RRG08_054824 [Elysia crispata]|uniref:BTB domain-containing protein n=1 Tax=Elysia crispata TaxID=231223 RepID=A0AAE1DFP7_9GAST|nr:hypothetical protein RRG08_054824 [Elysia crispata]
MAETSSTEAKRPDVGSILQQALSRDTEDHHFCDFSVCVDEIEYKCHRIVLSARSGFFRSMLTSGMKEATEKSATLCRITSDVFDIVLKWMYEGVANLTQENVIGVLYAADLLDVQCLVSGMGKCLWCASLSVDNCVSVFQIAGFGGNGSNILGETKNAAKVVRMRNVSGEHTDAPEKCPPDENQALLAAHGVSRPKDSGDNCSKHDRYREECLADIRASSKVPSSPVEGCIRGNPWPVTHWFKLTHAAGRSRKRWFYYKTKLDSHQEDFTCGC